MLILRITKNNCPTSLITLHKMRGVILRVKIIVTLDLDLSRLRLFSKRHFTGLHAYYFTTGILQETTNY